MESFQASLDAAAQPFCLWKIICCSRGIGHWHMGGRSEGATCGSFDVERRKELTLLLSPPIIVSPGYTLLHCMTLVSRMGSPLRVPHSSAVIGLAVLGFAF